MPKQLMQFATSKINVNKLKKNDDGALVFNGVVSRSGDFEYYAFEVPGAMERGYKWDDILIGRISRTETKMYAKQLEGLPVTDEHRFVREGERGEHAVGTVLTDGELSEDGLVSSRISIHQPEMVMKVIGGKAEELSIGFASDIIWRKEPGSKGPHFDVKNVNLNHVAVVPEGRGGKDVRLAHHKRKLSHKDKNMPKINIDGVEWEVETAVAQEFSRINGQVKELTEANDTLTHAKDKLEGELAASESATVELENSVKSEDQIKEAAAKLANDHAEFVHSAKAMGHEGELKLGEYDERALKVELLNKKGSKIPEDASEAFVNGAWDYALTHSKPKVGKSALDDVQPNVETANDMAHNSAKVVHDHYFGGKKQEKK